MASTDGEKAAEDAVEFMQLMVQEQDGASAQFMADELEKFIKEELTLLESANQLVVNKLQKNGGKIVLEEAGNKKKPPPVPGSAKRPARTVSDDVATPLVTKPKKPISKTKLLKSVGKTVVPKNQIRAKVVNCSCVNKCKNCHKGDEFFVEPKLKSDTKGKIVRIGRSTGDTYKKFGISLFKDDEVSTKHAKLTRNGQGFWITDMDSSNGTRVYPDGVDKEYDTLLPHEPYLLTNGIVVGIGGCTLKFTW